MKTKPPKIIFEYERVPTPVAAVQYKGRNPKSLKELNTLRQKALKLELLLQCNLSTWSKEPEGTVVNVMLESGMRWAQLIKPGQWLVLDPEAEWALQVILPEYFEKQYIKIPRNSPVKRKPNDLLPPGPKALGH